jgi:Na+-transporting NADH:ubiquinone oxidoreductase subunit A
MKTVKVNKGWRFKIKGAPSVRTENRLDLTHVAVTPSKIPFIKPRLCVQAGDRVKIGSPLFEDKKNPDIKFLSPGGGEIVAINYGRRRIIVEIIIALDTDESYASFESFNAKTLSQLDRKALISILMAGGVWPFIRQLPHREIADRKSKPAAIWVALDSADPFQPLPEVCYKDHQPFFDMGIKALFKLSDSVNISRYAKNRAVNGLDQLVTHQVRGNYPANDPGVVLYHTKQSATDNHAWYINGQDVLLIGEFLSTGRYPVARIVTFSDGTDKNSRHIKTRMGASLSELFPSHKNMDHLRWIIGGIFSGYTSHADGFLGMYETSVMVIKEAVKSEFFGFARPGSDKLSHSKTVLSAMSSAPLSVNSDMHGEERPCINCGYCAKICPVDILPQYTYKCIYADEIEEALSHGLLDCVECGLCSFVCPSKIELFQTFINAKHMYRKEVKQGV